jgi:putative hydrolase of the HAD superfamily
MTLIRSHASFKAERARYFFERHNHRHKTQEAVTDIFRKVDGVCNIINETTGRHVAAEELYLWVIGLVNDGEQEAIRGVDLESLYEDMEALFLAFPPSAYDGDTRSVLARLRKEVPEATFSILSNTAFIKGSTLRKVLPAIGLDDFWHFQLYSDETGFSKPSRAMFQRMLDEVEARRGPTNPKEIIHIGDNPTADIEGAKSAGISHVLINSNHESIVFLI